ncbi:hypothetical protein BC940DRAFT_362176 [Gongronella butleri]|nr:hypothetical protein BC940DRAFT_362176 [Gongronella butleri]
MASINSFQSCMAQSYPGQTQIGPVKVCAASSVADYCYTSKNPMVLDQSKQNECILYSGYSFKFVTDNFNQTNLMQYKDVNCQDQFTHLTAPTTDTIEMCTSLFGGSLMYAQTKNGTIIVSNETVSYSNKNPSGSALPTHLGGSGTGSSPTGGSSGSTASLGHRVDPFGITNLCPLFFCLLFVFKIRA